MLVKFIFCVFVAINTQVKNEANIYPTILAILLVNEGLIIIWKKNNIFLRGTVDNLERAK